MSAPAAEPVPAQLVSERGRWYVPVPWDRGDDLRLALARRGFPSTLCLNPETREARLELWANVSPAEFLAALEQLRGTAPPVARPASVASPPVAPAPVTVPAAQGA
jgi:hypothetical protein